MEAIFQKRIYLRASSSLELSFPQVLSWIGNPVLKTDFKFWTRFEEVVHFWNKLLTKSFFGRLQDEELPDFDNPVAGASRWTF